MITNISCSKGSKVVFGGGEVYTWFMKKRLPAKSAILLLLAILLSAMLSACYGSDVPAAPENGSAQAADGEGPSDIGDGAAGDMLASADRGRVLLDQDGVVVTLKGFVDGELVRIHYVYNSLYDEGSPALQLLVENNNDFDISLSADDTAVNGIMVYNVLSSDNHGNVAAGEKANINLCFVYAADILDADELGIGGIGQPKEFEFRLLVEPRHEYSNETMTLKSGPLIVTLPGYVSGIPTHDDGGIDAYDDGGIKIVAKKMGGVDALTHKGGADTAPRVIPDIYLYIENNSGKAVDFKASECFVNGVEMPWMDISMSTGFTGVLGGKKAFGEICFPAVWEKDWYEGYTAPDGSDYPAVDLFEANGIESVERLEFELEIVGIEDWAPIAGPVHVSIDFG